jgi:pimeloyl-ACP methyl ester carboxylesterase
LAFRIYWSLARKNPSSFIDMMKKQAAKADQRVLDDSGVLEMLLGTWEENLRIDSRGYVYDAEVLMTDWGFSMEGILTRVELWWGEKDENVPLQVMDYFSRHLPNCKTNLVLDAGHFGLLTHWERMF